MPMHKPTQTLPKHAIIAPEPLHLNLPRQIHDFDSERQLDLSIVSLHGSAAFLDSALVRTTVCAAPDVLAGFADAAGF
jgi:hypothetical protein